MAADLRKKPVRTVRITDSRDQGRVKKRKLGPIPYALKARSNISLEWDDKKNIVVAKREQIGLKQRHLSTFDSCVSHGQNALADILHVPQEIFELDSLKEVLSYEVWQTLLSARERHYLMQFLPRGMDMQRIVHELLVGHNNNFHFGNPFLKWSASLCSGDLHPDAILYQEHCIRASKKTYYSDLAKYHSSMINDLLMWKERCATSQNPEEEFMQKIWRSRKQAGNTSSVVDEYKLYDDDEDVVGTSESGSLAADEDASNSNNQNLVLRCKDTKQRKVLLEGRSNNLPARLKVVERHAKEERLLKQNILYGDGSKYMSYIKVSRKQHQRVKNSMKHSSNSIQSRSLNRVLGNLSRFKVQPFKVFEEEEQKKLHMHWLQLATKDVPAAFENIRRWRLVKSQLHHYWKQEMEDKLVFANDKEVDQYEEKGNIMLPTLVNHRASSNEAADTGEIEEKEHSDCVLKKHSDDGAADDDKLFIASGDVKEDQANGTVEEVMGDEGAELKSARENDSKFAQALMHSQCLQKNSELSGSHTFSSIEADTGDYVVKEGNNCQPVALKFSENLDRMENAVSERVTLSTSSNIWPIVSMGTSYRNSTLDYKSSSSRLLSLGHQGNSEEQAQLINLDSDKREEDAGDNLWHKQSHSGSFLSPCTDQDVRGRNELNQHYFRGPESSSYHHMQIDGQFDFQRLPSASSVSVAGSQYSGNMVEQPPSMPMQLDLVGEKRLKDGVDTDHLKTPEKMLSDGFRYNNIPMQQQSSSVNIQDWAALSTIQMSPPQPLQSHLGFSSEELVRNNRLVMEVDQIHDGWSNLDPSSPITGINCNSNIDQGFYGVLSQYNNIGQLPYVAPYDSVGGPPQRFVNSGIGSSYNSGGVPSALSHVHHPLDYSNSQEEAALPPLVKSNNPPLGTEWVNLSPHQSSALQGSMVRPFLRPWNS